MSEPLTAGTWLIAVPLRNALAPWFGSRAASIAAEKPAGATATRSVNLMTITEQLGFARAAAVDFATLATALLRYFGVYVQPGVAAAPRPVPEHLASVGVPASGVLPSTTVIDRLLAQLGHPPHEINRRVFTERACHAPRCFAPSLLIGEIIRADSRGVVLRGRSFRLNGMSGAERYVATSAGSAEHAIVRSEWRFDTTSLREPGSLQRMAHSEVIDPWSWSPPQPQPQAEAAAALTPTPLPRRAELPSARRVVLEPLES